MRCAVLAAGEGTRMRPLTQNKPKVMLPVAGKPILHWVLDALKKAGLSDFVFLIGYKGDVVKNYFGDGGAFGVKIEYVIQKEQLGTANAVYCLKDFLGKEKDGFIQINGDTLVKPDAVQALMKSRCTTLAVMKVSNPRDFGVIETKGNYVKKIIEKPKLPPANLANVGVYRFTPEIFDAIENIALSQRHEYEITDAVQSMIDSGNAVGFKKINWWLDIGKPWDMLTANEILMMDMEGKIKGKLDENVVIKGSVSVGDGTVIKSGTYIEGPVIIGRNCRIGPNTYVRPSTYIGDCCHIGAFTEIKNSIIMNGSNAPHLNYIGDSVIGERCNLGAGTKIANLRLDDASIYSILKDEAVDTGRRKLGAIIGDDVKTGINVSINVGSVIGAGAKISYGRLVHGYVPPGSVVA